MNGQPSVVAGDRRIRLEGDLRGFRAELSTREDPPGVQTVTLVLSADESAEPPAVTLAWDEPIVDIQAAWNPKVGRDRVIAPHWHHGFVSRATTGAPVMCLHDLAGVNRLTFAASDALNGLRVSCGVVEETACQDCRVGLFVDPHPPIDRYEVHLRLDGRDVPCHRALGDVARWWASQEGGRPAPVPEPARLPMYSTWYSFHQRLDPKAVEAQCRIAKDLGCEAVIVDDGWQTTDASRGYAYCGDWQPLRIPNLAEHVAAVHEIGMKFLLWYSVPHMGKHAEAFERFKDKFLYYHERHGAGILDPRYPDVREYLINTYEQALKQWDLDGVKLDFVDSLVPRPGTPVGTGDGRDIANVAEAADRLLSDVIDRLRAIKPDVMIEFRQSYVGPLMRKYGNVFRAGDCPGDAVTNRIRTLDIRLLCDATAAHSDMIMWHPDETVEVAALQLLNVLFSVPQISVMLDQLPPEHTEMLGFYLEFWRAHREVLLDGDLTLLHPESLYPVVVAGSRHKRVAAAYDDAIIPAGPDVPGELYVVNATRGGRVVLEFPQPIGRRRIETFDCRGRSCGADVRHVPAGVHRIELPPAGLATLTTA